MPDAESQSRLDVQALLADAGFREEFGRLIKTVHRKAPSLVEEADLHQDVMLLALKSRHQFHGSSRDEFRAWLYTIAYRQLLKYVRQAAHRPSSVSLADQPDEPSSEDDPSDVVVSRELLARVGAFLDDRETALLRARYGTGLSFEQIAKLTGETAASLRQLHHRLLRRLRLLAENISD